MFKYFSGQILETACVASQRHHDERKSYNNDRASKPDEVLKSPGGYRLYKRWHIEISMASRTDLSGSISDIIVLPQ